MGDAVDNIPGTPGIGEKTAMKLVQQFGSLEGVIEGADQLKGKQKENVLQFAEQGRMSKALATININAPVELDHDALHLDPPDKDKWMEVFSELEFKPLAARVLAQADPGGAGSNGARPAAPSRETGRAAAPTGITIWPGDQGTTDMIRDLRGVAYATGPGVSLYQGDYFDLSPKGRAVSDAS